MVSATVSTTGSGAADGSARTASADGRSAPLSRQAVIDHALALADVDGPAAVSIRRIAQDFGVTPMALYWHVKNKDELLAAMGDRILDTIDLPDRKPASGLEELRGLLAVLVDALHRHPGCTALAQQRVLACDSGRQLAERALDILRSNGFGVRQSADLSRAALQTSIMLVSGRPGAETATPQDERAAVLAGKRAALVGLPADRFPHLVECADALTDCDDEAAYYGAGIDLYLAGVTALQQCQAAAAR
ncbi:MAG TPA: TetR family transcriptional regulator [Nakamurella sp.]